MNSTRPHAVCSRRDRARRICAAWHNRRKCVLCAQLTGYGRKKLAAMLESNRRCAKNVLCANVVWLFIPTDACCLCARTMLVKSAGSTAKKWGRWWPRTLRKLPSGACGGQFNGTLSTLCYEAQRDAGSTGEFVGHTQAPPTAAKAIWFCEMWIADAHAPKSSGAAPAADTFQLGMQLSGMMLLVTHLARLRKGDRAAPAVSCTTTELQRCQ